MSNTNLEMCRQISTFSDLLQALDSRTNRRLNLLIVITMVLDLVLILSCCSDASNSVPTQSNRSLGIRLV